MVRRVGLAFVDNPKLLSAASLPARVSLSLQIKTIGARPVSFTEISFVLVKPGTDVGPKRVPYEELFQQHQIRIAHMRCLLNPAYGFFFLAQSRIDHRNLQ